MVDQWCSLSSKAHVVPVQTVPVGRSVKHDHRQINDKLVTSRWHCAYLSPKRCSKSTAVTQASDFGVSFVFDPGDVTGLASATIRTASAALGKSRDDTIVWLATGCTVKLIWACRFSHTHLSACGSTPLTGTCSTEVPTAAATNTSCTSRVHTKVVTTVEAHDHGMMIAGHTRRATSGWLAKRGR